MRRLRLVSLAVASTLLLTLSGCSSMCEDGRMFPRLFNRSSSSRNGMGAECECHSSGWPQGMGMPVGQGPFVGPMPQSATHPPIPITNTHVAQPQLFKVPQAPPTVYVPSHK